MNNPGTFPLTLRITGRKVVVVGGGHVATRRTQPSWQPEPPSLGLPDSDRPPYRARRNGPHHVESTHLSGRRPRRRVAGPDRNRRCRHRRSRGRRCRGPGHLVPQGRRPGRRHRLDASGGTGRRRPDRRERWWRRRACVISPRRCRRGPPSRRASSPPPHTPSGGGRRPGGWRPRRMGPSDSRGRRLLAEADVVVVDRLAPTAYLAELAPDVEVIDVGKMPDHHPIPQDEITRSSSTMPSKAASSSGSRVATPTSSGAAVKSAWPARKPAFQWRSCPA